MSEQQVLSVIAQRIIIKFLCNEDVKSLKFCDNCKNSLITKHYQKLKYSNGINFLVVAVMKCKNPFSSFTYPAEQEFVRN